MGTPFNLSPEAEADLMKLPIPDPVKHDPVKHRGTPKAIDHERQLPYPQHQQQLTPMTFDENTLDSIGDEWTPPNHVIKEDPGGGSNAKQSMDPQEQPIMDSGGLGNGGAMQKKKRRFNQAFKNNKCTACGKAFSRMTTAKKHFLDQHSQEVFDKTKIEITQ